MNIILVGPQGSGKGTQGHRLAVDYNLQLVEAGQILREYTKQQTEAAKEILGLMKTGRQVPNDVINEIIFAYLNSVDWKNGLLFDAYPRKVAQWEALQEYLKQKNQKIDAIINLDVSEKTSIERLSHRVMSSRSGEIYNLKTTPPPQEEMPFLIRREDDIPDAIKVRLHLYNQEAKPLLDYFKERHRLITIEAEGAPEVVYKEIVHQLQSHKVISHTKDHE